MLVLFENNICQKTNRIQWDELPRAVGFLAFLCEMQEEKR